MSVGHIARNAESKGIPTVAVMARSFGHVASEMKYARAVITRHPMGRPMGPPGDRATHDRVVDAALDLLASATSGTTIVELPEPYRPLNEATQRS